MSSTSRPANRPSTRGSRWRRRRSRRSAALYWILARPRPGGPDGAEPLLLGAPGLDLGLQARHAHGGVDDEALVRSLADLLDLVAHLEAEAEPAAIHRRQL